MLLQGVPKNATATKQCITFFNNTDKCKIFKIIVVLLYLILNLTTILLGDSSTGSDVITKL